MRSFVRVVVGAAALAGASLPLKAQGSYPVRCGTGIPPSGERGYVPLPRGDVFCPLVADPKAARSFASVLEERSDTGAITIASPIASVGIGDMFGLGRWNGARPGDGLQLSLSAGVFAQFDLGSPSYDMLNADYVIGFPVTLRSGAISARLRVYHQSSHLGDEYLLREPADRRDRENISFEAAEVILSVDAGPLRVYGGGERLFHREPDDLEAMVVHGGAELRPQIRVLPLGGLGGFRFVAAADLKSAQEHEWKPAVSARAGLEYDRAGGANPPARRYGIFAEYYSGPSPYGQFFRERVTYVGAGLHFGGF